MRKTIRIDGKNVFVWEEGDARGIPFLFLHGYAGDHRGLIEIAQKFPKYRVIVPDLPGFGRSEPLSQKHCLENYVDFLAAFVEALDINDGYVFGHSLGGSLALSFVEKFPKVFQKVSLAAPILTSEHWMAQVAKMYYKVAELLPRDMKKFMVDNKFLVYLTDSIVMTITDKKKRQEILEQNYKNYKQADADALSQAFFTFFEDEVIKDPRSIHLPLQIIAGESDFISPKEPLQKLHEQIEKSEFVVTEGGHLFPREFPEELCLILRRFIEAE